MNSNEKMTEGLKNFGDILPSDKELYERSKAWSKMFEKYENAKDDVSEAILVEYDPIEIEESEESISPVEFEDNEIDDSDFNVKEVLNETRKVVAKRQECWNESGIDRIMDSFCYNKIEEKVGSWLKNNTGHLSTKLNSMKSNKYDHYMNKIQINKEKIVMEHDSDQNSLDSVDTAKYILSNRKRRKSKVTMTIKKYCYSAKASNSILHHIDDAFFSNGVRKGDLYHQHKTTSPLCLPAKSYKSKNRRFHSLHLSRSTSSSSSSSKSQHNIRKSSRIIKPKKRISRKQAMNMIDSSDEENDSSGSSSIISKKNINLNDTVFSNKIPNQTVKKTKPQSLSRSKTDDKRRTIISRFSPERTLLESERRSQRISKSKNTISRPETTKAHIPSELSKKEINHDDTVFSDKIRNQTVEKAIPKSLSRSKTGDQRRTTLSRFSPEKTLETKRRSLRISKSKNGISRSEMTTAHIWPETIGLNKTDNKSNNKSTSNKSSIGSKEISFGFDSTEGEILNSTALKSQHSMIKNKCKFGSICEKTEDNSITSSAKRKQSVVLYSPNEMETTNGIIKNGKLQVTEDYLENNLGTEMKNKLLGVSKTFHYECSAKSKLLFIPPQYESNALSDSEDDILENLERLETGSLVEVMYV